ncbi:SH3 domain-containing YSC84-like protein 1 [Ceratocystis fimbriata CBS 114723]|uniref:SH3 domain-containing YSC84-like protein 1 n=1 Tax=Ceratocystis fimbriata CBS 114723 TaxID=1035309 RepID=A0A2C5X7P7_9PEZI|nr:SH3 domain-containing YSC84-like protein 1 [Ceratocystis fimbriata CBS 114723]
MQRVSALLSWDRRNSHHAAKQQTSPKQTSPKLKSLSLRPQSNGKFDSQQFWPAGLDQECNKAARILKSFCTDGYLAPLHDVDESESPHTDQPPEPQTPLNVTKRIPQRIIQNAAGIAVFTCMRSGLWMTGSGGSGILIARKADGTWSPPSALILHTPTLSFIIGVDVYDCVLIINNIDALESLTQPSTTLGEDVGLIGGPLVMPGADEEDIQWRDLGNTVFTYLKARGKAQKVNLNGCMLSERVNENHKFYEREVSVMDVLAGKVAKYAEQTGPLFEVIKQAEGRIDYDAAIIDQISTQPAPGDALIETPKAIPALLEATKAPRLAFGIPHPEDPDPFGLKALEMAGMEIREAGSRIRPPSSQFDGSSTKHYSRSSLDIFSPLSNRVSLMSTRTGATFMTDTGTPTTLATPATVPSPAFSNDEKRGSFECKQPEVDYTKIDFSSIRHLSGTNTLDSVPITESIATTTESDCQSSSSSRSSNPSTPSIDLNDDKVSKEDHSVDLAEISDESEGDEDLDDDEFDEFDDDEEPVVFEISAVQPLRAPQAQIVQAKGTMVTIAKRIPPPLPMRSPARMSRSSKSEMGDVSMLKSPLRQSFTNEVSQPESCSASVKSVTSSGASIVSIGSRGQSTKPKPHLEVMGHNRSRSLVVQHAQEVTSPVTPTSYDDMTPTAEHKSFYTLSPEASTPTSATAATNAATLSSAIIMGAESVSDEDMSSDNNSFKSCGTQNASTIIVS